jgi:hypothetical protein
MRLNGEALRKIVPSQKRIRGKYNDKQTKNSLTSARKLVADTADLEVDSSPAFSVLATAQVRHTLCALFVHVHVTC